MNDRPTPDTTSLVWRKSSYSNAGNNCVEVAMAAGSHRDGGAHSRAVAVRDSKSPATGHLLFSDAAWSAFIANVKAASLGS